MSLARELPILFSGPMVRAILDGRKTQTRRPLKPQPPEHTEQVMFTVESTDSRCVGKFHPVYRRHPATMPDLWESAGAHVACPFGGPGDRLWGRETWAPHADEEETFRNYHAARTGNGGFSEPGHIRPELFYRADLGEPHVNNWRPSIHLPRWASRLTLDVAAVRVDRLHDITEADARAEGFEPGLSWDANPWVWVVTFRRQDGGAR